ncbi:hypothetical protein EMIHUDRAFT_221342 [Emiliania huxleyi CCMP1516]|uniref:Uncharacterized protein n=2 Tax=Emiliania huxleyi TaxID=2903 RepID=A0A0D3HYZ8_EMIH1|nr:hypothetical protein EMIHUDRAFT_221342 [Emiliania huxleyi CCMP1516]EOD04233.1 hypothetical protein EMIHUDRAFT_221342 [Emiliania huxleyi CCMP1516]|eukprot:XP_005756662.1 hypothetical protein EMIHUDRAFT_221342 [Emiliania huxleyi CCMP1516]
MLIRLDLTRLAPPFKQFLCRVAAQSVPHVWSLLHLRAIAPAAPALSAVPGCWGQPGRHAGPSPPAATRVHNGASKDGRNRDDEADVHCLASWFTGHNAPESSSARCGVSGDL